MKDLKPIFLSNYKGSSEEIKEQFDLFTKSYEDFLASGSSQEEPAWISCYFKTGEELADSSIEEVISPVRKATLPPDVSIFNELRELTTSANPLIKALAGLALDHVALSSVGISSLLIDKAVKGTAQYDTWLRKFREKKSKIAPNEELGSNLISREEHEDLVNDHEELLEQLEEFESDLSSLEEEIKQTYADQDAEAGEKGDSWTDEDANRYGETLNTLQDEATAKRLMILTVEKKLESLSKLIDTTTLEEDLTEEASKIKEVDKLAEAKDAEGSDFSEFSKEERDFLWNISENIKNPKKLEAFYADVSEDFLDSLKEKLGSPKKKKISSKKVMGKGKASPKASAEFDSLQELAD